MILHIVVDDKFIDSAYRIFEEVYPGRNEFLLVSKHCVFKYIQKAPVRIISPKEFLGSNFIKSLSMYDMVVLHCLDDIKIKMLAKAPKDIKFVWIGWGCDYYYLVNGGMSSLFFTKTTELYAKYELTKQNSLKSRIKSVIKKCLTATILKNLDPRNIKITKINRINYFSPVLREDYDLVKKNIPNFQPEYLSWNYGTLEDDMIRGLDAITVTEDNILLGNSATYENNHLDAFELLSSINLEGKKVIVPLSYGYPKYRDEVITVGNKLMGEKFVPLVDYMPIDDYVKVISSCSIVIMNHLRQQAVGNIVIMMYLGAKVFLDKRNPVYDFLYKEGAHIFDIDDLVNGHCSISTRLTQSEITTNREILKKHWSRSSIHSKTKNLIKTVLTNEFK